MSAIDGQLHETKEGSGEMLPSNIHGFPLLERVLFASVGKITKILKARNLKRCQLCVWVTAMYTV